MPDDSTPAKERHPETIAFEVEVRPDPHCKRSRKGMTYLLDAQDVIHNRLVNFPCTHRDAAALACALDRLRVAIRREQMKPDAKPIDVSDFVKPRRLANAIEASIIPREAHDAELVASTPAPTEPTAPTSVQ